MTHYLTTEQVLFIHEELERFTLWVVAEKPPLAQIAEWFESASVKDSAV